MSLVKATQKQIVSSKSVTGAAGKGLVAGGAGAMGLVFLAGLIPFVGVFGLGVIMILLGLFMWE